MNIFGKIALGGFGVAAITAALFVGVILNTLLGIVSGWAVGLFFDQSIKQALTGFGFNVAGVEMWQIGAALGFVGGFFKSNLSTKEK